MTLQPPISGTGRRLPGLAATLALHLALLYAWLLAQQGPKQADRDDLRRIQWVNVVPPRPVVPVPPKLPVPVPAPRTRAARSRAPALPPPVHAAAEPEATTAPAAPAAATRSADQLMQQAIKDVGKIDRDLRKEFPGAAIKAPPDSPQLRLERGIEHAAEMAPPRWYEAPKITELVIPGGSARKRYRVITALGTYCVSYDAQGKLEKMTNCPKDEQPATTQKWEK